MLTYRSTIAAFVIGACWLATADHAAARSEEETVRLANEVLKEFLDLRVKQIPASLLAEAHGVAIIPNVIKVGLVVGGQHGKGVVVVREPDGSWRAPMFVSLTGGSIGWQVGAQSTDVVLVFKTQKSVEGLFRGKFTLGADAAVAAGPIGRRAGAATDAELKAEIYSYSRSRGLFAGVSLDGSALQVHDDANAAYYGAAAPGGAPPAVPQSALTLVQSIAQLTAVPQSVQAAPAVGPDLTPVPTPAARRPEPLGGLAALQAELAKSATDLSPLLDDAWRRYLALPAEVYERGRAPSADVLVATLRRFEAVAQNPQYRALAERAEFQATHGLLRAYYEALSATASPQLSLPPPPSVPR
jgi:lipid-binding SYLF domain-containing protein